MLKNKTQISKEGYLLLSRKVVKIFTWTVVVLLVVVSLYLGYENIQKDFEFSIIMWSVGGVSAIVLAFLLPSLIRKQLLKTVAKNPLADFNVFNSYEFDDDFVFVTSSRFDEVFGKVKLSYSDFSKVNRFGEMLLLALKSNQSYLVDLNCMTEGTAEELVQLLKNKVGEKNFKSYKK